jgi:hypothetical protein
MAELNSSKSPLKEDTMPEDQPASESHTGTDSGEDVPKPPFCEVYGRMDLKQGGLDTQARITGML